MQHRFSTRLSAMLQNKLHDVFVVRFSVPLCVKGSIQLSDETFLPRVQETLHIEHAFVAFGFLKVIELIDVA